VTCQPTSWEQFREVRRASPVNVPKNAFDKLLAAIDKKIFVPM
jgi:hypothetical protein